MDLHYPSVLERNEGLLKPESSIRQHRPLPLRLVHQLYYNAINLVHEAICQDISRCTQLRISFSSVALPHVWMANRFGILAPWDMRTFNILVVA